MGSDESESTTVRSCICSVQEEEFEDIDYDPQNLSRLSIYYHHHDEDDSFGDVEDELSDDGKAAAGKRLSSSESDKEASGGCYSLPATPPRRRTPNHHYPTPLLPLKDYVSENEYKGQKDRRRRRRRTTTTTTTRKRRESHVFWKKELTEDQSMSLSGESQSEGGVMLITRPKGGRRSLQMDMEEVKACRDLGFELEIPIHPPPPPPSHLSLSSGASSPVSSNWRISSPGDDPRDVKARLKIWAQAVALASASRHST